MCIRDRIVVLGKTKLLVFDPLTKTLSDSIKLPKKMSNPKLTHLIDHKNRLWMLAGGILCRVNPKTKVWE